jgi:hypothetical protein
MVCFRYISVNTLHKGDDVVVVVVVVIIIIIIIINCYIGHSTHTHTAESANVEAQKSLILQTALYAPLTVRAG